MFFLTFKYCTKLGFFRFRILFDDYVLTISRQKTIFLSVETRKSSEFRDIIILSCTFLSRKALSPPINTTSPTHRNLYHCTAVQATKGKEKWAPVASKEGPPLIADSCRLGIKLVSCNNSPPQTFFLLWFQERRWLA